jgi:imidazolonepropionase-like amidohydrolase
MSVSFRQFAALVLILACCLTCPAAAQHLVAIKGATLIDGTGRLPARDAVVLIDGERIVAVGTTRTVRIPRRTQVIDATGKFLLPGLIDCHCHLEIVGLGDSGELPAEWSSPARLRELTLDNARLDLAAGITTVRDLGSTPLLFHVRDEINQGKFPGPRVFAAGQQLTKRSSGAYSDPIFLDFDGVDDARHKVRYLLGLGADVIKVRLTNQRPLPSSQELRAIVEEAHRHDRRVTVHTDVPAEQAVRLAIDAGVDGIEHNAPLRVADPAVLREIAAKRIFVVSGAGTLYTQRIESFDSGASARIGSSARRVLPPPVAAALEQAVTTLQQQTVHMKQQGWDPVQVQRRFAREMQQARDAGVLLGFGTDCGADLMIHGQQYKALYGETQMGSTPMQAILMATRDAAKIIGREKDLGTVEPGKLADLIVLNADPLSDLRNIRTVSVIVKGGKLYKTDDLIAPAAGRN